MQGAAFQAARGQLHAAYSFDKTLALLQSLGFRGQFAGEPLKGVWAMPALGDEYNYLSTLGTVLLDKFLHDARHPSLRNDYIGTT